MKRKVFIFFALLLSFFGLTSCKKEEKVQEPTVVDLEISKNPTKVEYFEGEAFDPSGMVVKTILDNGFKIVLFDYDISKTTALTTGDTKIDITYGEFTKSVNITVNHKEEPIIDDPDIEIPVTLDDVELRVAQNYTYTVTEDIGNNIQYREKYSDGSTGEWKTVVADDISSVEYKQNKLKINLEFVLESENFGKSVEVNINEVALTSVDEIYEKTANDGKTYYLHGVVAALECTMKSKSAGEYFIKDMNSDTMIAVQGLCTEAQEPLYNYTEKVKFDIGDEVVLPVKYSYVNLSQSSDYKKPLCMYVGSSFVKTAVVSKDNDFRLDHSKATVISSQGALREFLSADNRLKNYYKLVKLSGDLHYVVYGVSKQHRFFFDNSISKNADQYCDGSSPVFMDCNTFYTTGKKFNELMWDGNNYLATNDDYTSKLHSSKDIYCFLAGGNLYYHEFAIMEVDDVIEPTTGIKLNTTFVAPTKIEYALGQELDLTGGKIIETYNYAKFNKEITLTSDMIASSTVNKDVEGHYVVTFKVNNVNYIWNVSYLEDIPEKIEVAVAPTKSTYTHRQGLKDINLSGGKILVTKAGGGQELVDMTASMLQKTESPDWKVGVVNYTLTYKTVTCTLPITFENKAISVEKFLGEAIDGETYDLNAIVMGATSSFQTAELVLKSTTTSKLMGVKGVAKLVGAWNAVKLDTTKINIGDEIIIQVKKARKTGKAEGHIYGSGLGTDGVTSYDSVIVVSHNNDVSYDLENALVIDTQEKLAAFCVDPNRFYTLVKLVDVKTVYYDARLRLEFEEFPDLESQKINETSPVIPQAACQGIDIYKYWNGITKSKGNDFTAVGTSEYDVYCLFITTYVNSSSGPVSHTFVVMDESWFVKAR